MKTKYVCLSDPIDVLFGERYTRNPSEKWTVIQHGTLVRGIHVTDVDSAAGAFASRIARRTFNTNVKVWSVSADGVFDLGKYFECEFGDRSIETKRFAVFEKTS